MSNFFYHNSKQITENNNDPRLEKSTPFLLDPVLRFGTFEEMLLIDGE
jgi:hypothetical protein